MLNSLMGNPRSGIHYFKYAREEALKSTFRCRVGACIVNGKSIVKGHNKQKTHPFFANPQVHLKVSLHAELDCLSKVGDISGATMYIYRETKDGKPGLSRPCEHCMSFLKKSGITRIFYSIKEYPYFKEEVL